MNEDEYFQLSGIQHFAFCKRQWELIHIDGLWKDNVLTLEGNIFHSRAHDNQKVEIKDGILIMRSVHLRSDTLRISGMTDILEFRPNPSGICIRGYKGKWLPYPVEYKHGDSKTLQADSLQLCAEAMCLEEMLKCTIHDGALFYGKVKHRVEIVFDNKLRSDVINTVHEMFQLIMKHKKVEYKYETYCDACSLYDQCQPKLIGNATEYIKEYEKTT